MSKTITIIGATGRQGGAVARILLESKQWKIRAVTRNTNSESAKALSAQGAELASADMNDEESLVKAFAGSHAVFALTNYWERIFRGEQVGLKNAGELEEVQGMNAARAAARTTSLEHYIWSTIPSSYNLTGGRIPVYHWDYKSRVDDRIRAELPELAAKTTYLYFGYYSDGMVTQDLIKPVELPGSYGKYAWMLPTKRDAYISSTGDMDRTPGIWARQILANPTKSKGKYAAVIVEVLTFEKILQHWSELVGKPAVFYGIDSQDYANAWGDVGEDLAAQFKFGEEFSDWTRHLGLDYVSPHELGIKKEEVGDTRQALEIALKQAGVL